MLENGLYVSPESTKIIFLCKCCFKYYKLKFENVPIYISQFTFTFVNNTCTLRKEISSE